MTTNFDFTISEISDLDLLSKFAMAGPHHIYRNQMKWFKYEDVVAGHNEEWNEMESTNPTLKHALNEITKFRNNKQLYFSRAYGYAPEEVNKIFKVFIGYDPNYGVYLNSVGPYYGSKDAIWKGKFAFFTRRFQTANEEDITNSAMDILGKKLKQYSDYLDLSDFSLKLKKATEGMTKGGYQTFEEESFDSLDPNSPEGRQLYSEKPILGSNSQINLNAKGLTKLMNYASETGGWKDLLEKAIHDVALSKQIDPEQLKTNMSTDYNLAKAVFNSAKSHQIKLIEAGDPAAQMMAPIPEFIKWGHGKAGSQITSVLQTAKIAKSMLEFKDEVLTAVLTAQSNDPAVIADFINKFRLDVKKGKGAKAKGKITQDIVQYWIDEISKELEPNENWQTGFKRLKEKTSNAIVDANNEEGFDDFDTALQVSSLNFAEVSHDQIDPHSKAKLTMFTPPPMFQRDEGTENVDSKELVSRFRLSKEEVANLSKKNKGKRNNKEEADDLMSEIGSEEEIQDEIVSSPFPSEEKEMEESNEESDEQISNFESTSPINTDSIESPNNSNPENDFSIIDNTNAEENPIDNSFEVEDDNVQEVVPEPEIAKHENDTKNTEEEDEELKSLFSNTITNLRKLANIYISEGNHNEAKEICKIIRKYT